MTIEKDKAALAKARMLKTIRTAIRLKHSLLADEELNELLPKAEAEFEKRNSKGELPAPLDVKKALGL